MSENETFDQSVERPQESACPDCAGIIAPDATRCRHCGMLLKDFVTCAECMERIHARAKVCRWCGARRSQPPPIPQAPVTPQPRLEPAAARTPGTPAHADRSALHIDRTVQSKARDGIDLTVGTTPIGGFLCNRSITALFRPAEFRIHDDEVIAQSWYSFGLRRDEDRLPLRRIASVRLTSGVFWSSIYVEAAGMQGGHIQICGLKKKEARDLIAVLEQQVLQISRPPDRASLSVV